MYSSRKLRPSYTHTLHTNTILTSCVLQLLQCINCRCYTYDRLENTLISVTALPDLFLSYTPQLESLNLNYNKITQLQTLLFGKPYCYVIVKVCFTALCFSLSDLYKHMI